MEKPQKPRAIDRNGVEDFGSACVRVQSLQKIRRVNEALPGAGSRLPVYSGA